jgi:hypothetical protein
VELGRGGARIGSDVAAALELKVGDPVRVVAFVAPPLLETPKAV